MSRETPRTDPKAAKTIAAGVIAGWIAAVFFGYGAAAAEGPSDCPSRVEESGTFSSLMDEARELHERGCRPAVNELAEHLLGRAEEELGRDSLEVADVLDLLTESHFWLGQRSEKEIEWARRALKIRRSRPQSDRAALARSHLNLGAHLSAKLVGSDRAVEALEHFEAARVLWEEEVGAASPEVADLLTWIAELLDDWGEEGRGRAKALAWIAELLDPETGPGRSVRDTLERIVREVPRPGASQLDAARLAEEPELAVALRAVALARAAGAESAAYAEALNTLGNLLDRRQLYDEALVVFDECLKVRIRVFPPGHPQIARAYHNRGAAYLWVGRLDAARPDLETGYAMRLALAGDGFPGTVATSLQLLGKLSFFTGDLQRALVLYKDALPRLRNTYGTAHWRYAEGLTHLAEACEELGEAEDAKRYYREALAVLGRSVSPEKTRTAAAQARLGTLLVATGEPEAGERLLRRARHAQESLPQLPLVDHAQTLDGLAEAAEKDGRAADALRLRRLAVTDLERYDGTYPGLIDAYLAVAESEVDAGDPEAERHLARVQALLPGLGEAAYGAQAGFHLLRARWLAAQDGRHAEALADAVRAANLYARHLAPAFRVLPQETALRFALRNRQSLELTLSLLAREASPPEAVARAWQAVALNRGLVTEELEERHAWVRQEGDPELRRLLLELQEARRQLAQAQVRLRQASTVEERTVLLRYSDARVRRAEQAVAEKSASARLGEPEGSFRLSDLVGELPAKSALVAYVRFGASGVSDLDERYGAFVTPAGELRPRFVDLGPAGEIDDRVREWRSALLTLEDDGGGPASRLRREGAALRREVWDPVARIAGGDVRRFFLVPDGSLFFLPFEALPGSSAGSYLIEDGVETHLLVGERDLRSRRDPEPRPAALLALGAPDFNAGATLAAAPAPEPSWLDRARETTSELFREFLRDPCRRDGKLYFLPLPEAGTEAREVAAIFRDGNERRGREVEVTSLSAAEATEAAFKRLAPSYSVLHVATHGFFDLKCRGGPEVRGFGDMLLDAPDQERFVSGLAFAGANFSGERPGSEDGILTVPEIVGLDLSGVDWVVLSACETALGPVASGEGVLGLARSFRVAGAGTLILSLWPVEDRATREWMTELYQARFRRGETTLSSLHSASLSILKKRRQEGRSTDPYYWAAFVAMGGFD